MTLTAAAAAAHWASRVPARGRAAAEGLRHLGALQLGRLRAPRAPLRPRPDASSACRAGGHVAIISENRKEWVFAQLGRGHGRRGHGRRLPDLPAPRRSSTCWRLSESRVVVCEDQEQVDKVLEVRERACPRSQAIVVIDPKGCAATTARRCTTSTRCWRSARSSSARSRGSSTSGSRRQRGDDIGADDLHLRLDRPPEGGDDLLRQHRRDGRRGRRRDLRLHRGATRCCPTCRCATWPSRCFTVFVPLAVGAPWSTSPRACARCSRTCARSRRRSSSACRASGRSCTPRSRSRSREAGGFRRRLFERAFAAVQALRRRGRARPGSVADRLAFGILVSAGAARARELHRPAPLPARDLGRRADRLRTCSRSFACSACRSARSTA